MEFSAEHLPEQTQDNLRVMLAAAAKYRDDPDFRSRVETEPRGALEGLGMSIQPPEVEVRVSANTAAVIHVVITLNPNAVLSDESMQSAVGGSTASSAATAGSATTLGCLPSCASSASSASTVGSAGSAG